MRTCSAPFWFLICQQSTCNIVLDPVDFSLARQAQPTPLQEAGPPQLRDFAFVLAEFDEIPLNPFLQPVQVHITTKRMAFADLVLVL